MDQPSKDALLQPGAGLGVAGEFRINQAF